MRYKAKNFKASRLLHKYTIENEMKVYIIMFFTMMQARNDICSVSDAGIVNRENTWHGFCSGYNFSNIVSLIFS